LNKELEAAIFELDEEANAEEVTEEEYKPS
jgi:hypothetical protein